MNLDTAMSNECKENYKNAFLDHYHKLKRQVTKCPWDKEAVEEFSKSSKVLTWICFKI